MVVVVLSNAGDQVPVTPLFEVVGKAVNGLPEHIGFIGLKEGIVGVIIVKSKVSSEVGLVAILKLFNEMKLLGVDVVKTRLVKGVVEKYPKVSVSVFTVLLSISPSE